MKKVTIAEFVSLAIALAVFFYTESSGGWSSDMMTGMIMIIMVPLLSFVASLLIISIALHKANVSKAFYYIIRNPLTYLFIIPPAMIIIAMKAGFSFYAI